MVTNKRIDEMRHPYHTNINESLNMRIADICPKNKNFSRSGSLVWRKMNVVGVHNLGPKIFYKRVLAYLQIDSSIVLVLWLDKKEKRRVQQKNSRQHPENKRKRGHKRNNKTK